MKGFIGLDLGSTAVKGVAVTTSGNITAQVSHRIIFNTHESVHVKEIDPDYFITTVMNLITELSAYLDEVIAVSWVTASGNILFLDQHNTPLTPIMSWLDRQPVEAGFNIHDIPFDPDEVYKTVGWPFSVQFPLGRLLWLKNIKPSFLDQCSRICMHNEYLGFMLTGRFAVDRSTATTGFLANQKSMRYHAPFLKALGLDASQLSEIVPTATVLGTVSDRTLVQTETCKAVLGSFDHPGAARALGIHRNDQLMLSCGTSWVGFTVLENRSEGLKNHMLIDPYEIDTGGSWAGMFSLTGAGQCLDSWLAVFFRLYGTSEVIDSNAFARFDAMAADSYTKSAHTPIIDMFHEDPEVTLLSLSSDYSKEAVALALLENIVFAFKHRMEEVHISLEDISEVYLVGGPSNSRIWTQIIADVLQCSISVSFGMIAGAVGAASMAAHAVNEDLTLVDPYKRIVYPDRVKSRLYADKATATI